MYKRQIQRPIGPFIASIIDAGFNVILKVSFVPKQPFSSGVITISTFVLLVILLFVKNPVIELAPLLGFSPIEVAAVEGFATQLKFDPGIEPLNKYEFNESPAHKIVSLVGLISGVGLIVIRTVSGAPGHAPNDGVTVMVAS